jgi:hypothetical protein
MGAGPCDHLGVLDKPFSLARAAAQSTNASADRRFGRRLSVTFDDAMPEARRRGKLEDWGRTYWRLELSP